MKLLRTVRFDASDERVYDSAAAPGEWAVSGAFAFADVAPDQLTGKRRQAFANGFLGVETFGRSTFATVAEALPKDIDVVAASLARHFVEVYGAPDIDTALPAAREEITFVADLCRDVAINTVFTVRRVLAETGEIREEFRTIRPPGGEPMHAKIWTVVEDDA